MFQIAQINIARMIAPLDSPTMAGFIERLADINALADQSPGFVWRLQTSVGDATLIRIFDDERLIVNMSVWSSIEALFAFSYKSDHTTVMSRRMQWFERMTTPHMALWWLPAGTIPEPTEGKARLAYLAFHGPTSYAFSFRTTFPMPQIATESNKR